MTTHTPTTTEEATTTILTGLEAVAETGGYREQVAALKTAVAMRWLDNYGAELHRRRSALVVELVDVVKPEDYPDIPERYPFDSHDADGDESDVKDGEDWNADDRGEKIILGEGEGLDLNADTGREKIIFGEVRNLTTVASFGFGDFSLRGPITPTTARELVAGGYADPTMRQNDSPTNQTMITIAEIIGALTSDHTTAGLGGYLIPPDRPDARVSFTSVTVSHSNQAPEADHETAAAVLGHLGEAYDADRTQQEQTERFVWWD